jgi:uncharacterized protein (TIGR03086 family)
MANSLAPHLVALHQAGLEFSDRSAQIGDRWAVSTICDDWTVADLVDHIVGGSRMTVGLLRGASREEGIDLLTADPEPDRLGALQAMLADQAAAFAAVDTAAITVHHPATDMSGEQLLGFRTLDLALHSWDLARSLGLDEQLDDHLVATVWDFLQPIAGVIGQLGMFGTGPSGDVPADAPLQARLIDLTGRRP